ncbi:MAG: preprotein translocase subunit SecY [Candidatus Nanoarchaeia archaeon]|nr:preprotein translocase subunit SecY [Candidatus Nanoarchaeia archaeon]
MSFIDNLIAAFPEVKKPEGRLTFKEKLKWTAICLIAFFVLSAIPLFGLGANQLSQFEQLSIILGASFGSIMSLGIGPIVTASIVLQLLKGSGLWKADTSTKEGRARFQGIQKLLSIFFIFFEALIYVLMGGLAPSPALAPSQFVLMQILLVAQLCIGGILVLFMDDLLQKWGLGSGISLFIAAGVASQIFVRAFSPLSTAGTWAFGSGQAPVGQVWVFLNSLISGNPMGAGLALSAILATIIVFVISVYGQAMKVEIPLSFGRIRGHGIRWPLHFLYTSNIPVILVAALMANMQLWAGLLEKWGHPILGTFSGSQPVTGFVAWINSPNLVQGVFDAFNTGAFEWSLLAHAATYGLFMIGGSILFSIFWVQTSGMDARSQADQIMNSGLQIPGFRRDPRVIEQLLKRYIFPLTIMGGATIGFLASAADLLGALSRGTGILLTVMILYRMYEDIAKQHMMDMNPAMRKIMGGK